ncbi:golgin subfamily A member 2-like [Condylostylus longicornis]|uniref:golgin subfamily A member 2-like n=1 Tax=Condylostylus longicornis TaxID=2530218 RepID=UPI00244D9B1E|nr:golgin subfamily A member 2-like [Condylostylus longicornis]
MADKERAKKLAAAKKKLKAYKAGGEKQISSDEVKPTKENIQGKTFETPKLQNYFNNKDNSNDFILSEERSPFNNISQTNEKTPQESSPELDAKETVSLDTVLTPFQVTNQNPDFSVIPDKNEKDKNDNIDKMNVSNSLELLKTIEVLISEKAHLIKESSKLQISCKEKDFEIEELRTRLCGTNRQIEELEQFYFSEQKKNVEMLEKVKNLESELNKYKIQSEEFSEHIQELKRELSIDKSRITNMEAEMKEKNSQLELNNVQISQISDENKITIDNRIETLTQTKFMYEQQIVDLQSMVQQLRAEKEQANQQYQNYVQHLNKDVASLSEKNSELTEDNRKLAERERDLVNHISNLEREIQQNITKNENLRQNMKSVSTENIGERVLQENELKEQITHLKKQEETLKKTIEENEKKIVQYRQLVEEKSEEINALLERISNLEADRPNDAKLLASIESDKVAASRAMSQNNELRKQLDEVQLKLIELTNDKMDLTNTLDSERFINKQTRQNFEDMQNQIKTLSDQMHFKDEEMIRLTHENNELIEKLSILQKTNEDISTKQGSVSPEMVNNATETLSNEECVEHSHNTCETLEHSEKNDQAIQMSDSTSQENLKRKDSDAISLPTSEAILRLEERFKKLMGEVADLTDEKQQLEHIVLQLQGETETIGEYIALYQSQRKILKNKEYERDAQLKKLLAEREDLRTKALKLELLMKQVGLKNVNSINYNLTEMPKNHNTEISEKILSNGHQETQNVAQKDTDYNKIENIEKTHNYQHQIEHDNVNKFFQDNITESDSQKIIEKIQSLVADLKNNKETLPLISTSVDHCACCSGKFETI